MASRVTLRLASGRRLESTCLIPPGMAGDPDRLGVVEEKLVEEGAEAIGRGNARRLHDMIMAIERTPIPAIVAVATGQGDDGPPPGETT